jgi:hypothetical protein
VTIYDLLFVVLFLTGAGTLLTAAVAALRGHPGTARVLLRRLGLGAVIYLGIVAAVSLISPQRFLELGDEQCADDWCIAATAVHRSPGAAAVAYEVTFRISSRARRVAQRERGVAVYLRDRHGRRYAPAPGAGIPFDMRLEPGQQVTTARVFALPAGVTDLGLVIVRGSGSPFPGCCIIGDESSLLHKRTIVRLEPTATVSAAWRRPASARHAG